MNESFSLCTVDAFTERPFSGNQAAVCFIGNKFPCDDVLQQVASEINLAETAFVVSMSNNYKEEKEFDLRWFTPTNEVPLCGHATLASAAALFEVADNINKCVSFSTKSGVLYAHQSDDGFITMDLPLNAPVKVGDATRYSEMCLAILKKRFVDRVREIWLSRGAKKLLIRMDGEFERGDLESLKPSFDEMLALHDGSEYKGVIVTTSGINATDAAEFDFLSRYFAPWNGIPEDHVTGSAHTVLAPYWMQITGKSEMLGRQCSKRGGNVKVFVRDDGRVDVGGKAVVVFKGSIKIPT